MEGRVPPTGAEDADDDPPPPPRPPSPDTNDTYIVQIPRDQIYRVPPPANAQIVECYRNPSRRRERCGGKCCLWVFVALFALAAIVGIGVAITYIFSSPKAPEFSVTKFHLVKNQPAANSHAKHTHPTYEISLQADNPNERMGISYEDGGKTSLSFEQKSIGGGEYPPSSQDAKDSTIVRVNIAGSNGALPSEMEKSIKDTKSKTPVSLSLTIDVPIKLKGFIPRSKQLTVTCDFKVSTSASGTKIVSQKCDEKL